MCCVQEVDGVNEKELSTDTGDSSHTTDTGDFSRTTLSESQYTHIVLTCTQVDQCDSGSVLLYAVIDDLAEIEMALKNVNNWLHLGLQLGLHNPTLKRIEKDQHELIDKCKTEMLMAWLQQQDNVYNPCCANLKAALEKIGEKQVASAINP